MVLATRLCSHSLVPSWTRAENLLFHWGSRISISMMGGAHTSHISELECHPHCWLTGSRETFIPTSSSSSSSLHSQLFLSPTFIHVHSASGPPYGQIPGPSCDSTPCREFQQEVHEWILGKSAFRTKSSNKMIFSSCPTHDKLCCFSQTIHQHPDSSVLGHFLVSVLETFHWERYLLTHVPNI